MLVIKAFINNKQIDELHIQNVGRYDNKDTYSYKIRKPEGYDNLIIKHKRSEGWMKLLKKVLHKLNLSNYKTPKKEDTLIDVFKEFMEYERELNVQRSEKYL